MHLRGSILSLTLALTACGSGTSTPRGTAPPGAAVSGTVLAADGTPAANVAVKIGAVVTQTDASGRFAASGVADEYDVAVARDLDATIFAFQGLTRRDPTLWLFEPKPNAVLARAAKIHVTGLASPAERLLVFADAASDSSALSLHTTDTADGVDVQVSWGDGAASDVALHALRYEVAAGSAYAARYTGLATSTVHVADGGSATWAVASFDPIGTKTIRTQVASPDDVTVQRALLALQLAPDGALTALPVEPPSATSTVDAFPDFPGAALVLAALGAPAGSIANGPYTTSRVTSASGAADAMTIRLPSIVSLVSPAAGATDVGGATEFAWTPSPDAPHAMVRFEPDMLTPVVAPLVYVQTTRSTAHLPDTAGLAVKVPVAAKYGWQVLAASWMPEAGSGKPAGPSGPAGAEERVSVSELRNFDVASAPSAP